MIVTKKSFGKTMVGLLCLVSTNLGLSSKIAMAQVDSPPSAKRVYVQAGCFLADLELLVSELTIIKTKTQLPDNDQIISKQAEHVSEIEKSLRFGFVSESSTRAIELALSKGVLKLGLVRSGLTRFLAEGADSGLDPQIGKVKIFTEELLYRMTNWKEVLCAIP